MFWHRRVNPMAALAVAMVASQLPAVSAGADEPVVLTERLQIVATAPATQVPVTVPRDVVLGGSCAETNGASYVGTADAMLVVLTPRPYTRGDFVEFFARMPGTGSLVDSACGSGRRIAAGGYTMTVLRSPGTASLELTLPGLEGNSAIAPVSPSQAGVAVLPRTSPDATTAATSSAGAKLELAAPGNNIVIGEAFTSAPAGTKLMGSCEYGPGNSPPPSPLTYQPPCPTAASSRTLSSGGSGRSYFASSATAPESGAYYLGTYYVGTGLLRPGGALAATIPVE